VLASPICNLTNVTVLLACFVPFDEWTRVAGRPAKAPATA